MRSEQTRFVGGPLDGRVLAVLVGPTGRPPKYYRVPVPATGDAPAGVLVYRLAPVARGRRTDTWRYDYAPDGPAVARPRWPWGKGGS
ncbi:hypothetical protein POF50_030750 [Streptomyces sp. SL13]|uniref:Uncharacterized protein n=1 Tax=Streptantibioticus silvisoli TaxID=2705255 RepID=A0AA90HBB9_9ACTN|nr:hypothetical protein [Streptantibioticus silvisoli]MDI5966751.1 hypothetical protein [Streptantibioticus silvisoli]MDI5973669.1 hypothetical protein [Streptantibioticus silvisoli]